MPIFKPAEVRAINEVSIVRIRKNYHFHADMASDTQQHGPRIKILLGDDECGTIPVLVSRVMTFSETTQHEKFKVNNKDLPSDVINFGIGLAIYARPEIIDYYYNFNDSQVGAVLKKKAKDYLKIVGENPTASKMKKAIGALYV